MRSQFVNMVGYAGDITTAKSRLGIKTALVMVKGGTVGTAIKVVTCSTSDGVFTDYVKLADGATDIVKGFFVDLSGADKYIKVTGATYADVVFADCDFDPKSIVTTGTVPTPSADLDNNKTKTIDVSTYTEPVEITPTAGKDGMKKATVTLSNIPSGDSVTLYAWKKTGSDDIIYTNFDVSPTDLEAIQNGDYKYTSSSYISVSVFGGENAQEYTRTSDTAFTIGIVEIGTLVTTSTYTRSSEDDVTFWE